ncbi:uncharacterized protein [Onthophagus taurus]|uniref:uncharacterized protein n=1 Tax=Onthophagus taurus TaxID=166361 RepID=UPI0039BE53B1
MPPTKDSKKNLDVENCDKEPKEIVGQNQQECETDTEEKPLQIDTENEIAITKNENETSLKESQAANSKRTGDLIGNVTPAKKARPKPKPVKIENMKEYVDNNTIEKLTTTTLFHWLKERNLHCSTRDKKADLIQKIKNQFVTTSS